MKGSVQGLNIDEYGSSVLLGIVLQLGHINGDYEEVTAIFLIIKCVSFCLVKVYCIILV
jgi:hypothetical protein